MADARKVINYAGWPGGLFDAPNPRDMLRIQLSQADNVMLSERGVVRQRYGLFGDQTAAAEILNFISTLAGSGSFDYATLTNKTITDYLGAVVHTYGTGGRGQFIFAFGKYSHSNGLDAMQTWASGDVATAATLGAPLSRLLYVHNDRVFCALNQTLYETAPGTGPSSSVDNFATGQTWSINNLDNDPIIALCSINRDLYIFKSKTIWIQTGYTVSERQTQNFSWAHGCVSSDTPKKVMLKGIGEAIIFLSTTGKLCAIYGGSVHEIGEAVKNLLDSITKNADTTDTIPTTIAKHRAVAAVHPDGYYLLGFAIIGGNTPSNYVRCLCVHLNVPYESQFIEGTRWAITKFIDTGSAFKCRFGAMAESFGSGYGNTVVTAQAVDGSCKGSFVFISSAVAKDNIVTLIPDTIRTNDDPCDDETSWKNIAQAVVYASLSQGATFTYKFSEFADQGDSTPISGEARSLAIALVNTVYPSGGPCINDVRRVAVGVSMTVAGGQVNGIEVHYTKGAKIGPG